MEHIKENMKSMCFKSLAATFAFFGGSIYLAFCACLAGGVLIVSTIVLIASFIVAAIIFSVNTYRKMFTDWVEKFYPSSN